MIWLLPYKTASTTACWEQSPPWPMPGGQWCSCGSDLGEYEYARAKTVPRNMLMGMGDPIPVLSQCLGLAYFPGIDTATVCHGSYTWFACTHCSFAHTVTVMAYSNDVSWYRLLLKSHPLMTDHSIFSQQRQGNYTITFCEEGLGLWGFSKLHCFFFIPLTLVSAYAFSCCIEKTDKFLAGRQFLPSKDAYFCSTFNWVVTRFFFAEWATATYFFT